MYFFPKDVSFLPRGVLIINPIWIKYGSTTNSNIEESSPIPAAIESKPIGLLLFRFKKDKNFLSTLSKPLESIF